MELRSTARGFDIGEFTDCGGEKCSIQESSFSIKGGSIWLGIHDANPQILSSDAIRLGLRKPTFDEKDRGWVKYEIPKEVLLSTRMLLNREKVKALLPLLKKFAKTGTLS